MELRGKIGFLQDHVEIMLAAFTAGDDATFNEAAATIARIAADLISTRPRLNRVP